ncbi:MAG: class I SAM-dependent methyltransferase [Pseudomonadota bacterium]|nr:class I SAM-dependent methyltransferase [Pseudomonadota bacterium]
MNTSALSVQELHALNPERSFEIGLKDVVFDGWYQPDGHLYHDFPIAQQDIVVDVGCGDGGNLRYCGAQGAHLVAADIDADKVRASVEHLRTTRARQVEGIVGDSRPLAIADAFATRVICTEVMEHVADVRQFLGELVRIGQPGALYLLTVPDTASEHLQKNTVASEFMFRYPNHIRIFERDEFSTLVQQAGLHVIRQNGYSFFGAVWWGLFWLCKSDPSLRTADPLALSWAHTWSLLMDLPGEARVRAHLNQILPKSQIIVARKP